MRRVKSICPTISQSQKKLNGVIEAVQFKYKRMANFVLEQNDYKKGDFLKAGRDTGGDEFAIRGDGEEERLVSAE